MTVRNFGWIKAGFITLFAVGLLVFPVMEAAATHLRAGQIEVKRLSPGSRRCLITITVYTDIDCDGGCVLFGGELDVLNFGDGSSMLVPETPATPLPGVPGVGKVSFSIVHVFPGSTSYTVSYKEPNRNAGVLNMDNSIGTTFYIETKINLAVNGKSESPEFKIDPIDIGCTGVAFMHNPGAFDPDQIDSLSYHIVTPFSDRNTRVSNYRPPNDKGFYTGLNYDFANEAGTGRPTFAIDSLDGTLTWDAPGKAGEYNIAFIVKEWRKIGGKWVEIGFVRRDMQIIVQDCSNERPTLDTPKDICAEAGTIIRDTITGFDLVEHHPVKIEAFSEIFNFDNVDSPASYSPVPGPNDFRPSPAKTFFTWNTICGHVKDQDYQVVFKITDKPSVGPGLATFETWRIKIVAPAPLLDTAIRILPDRHVKLEWEPYVCNEDASVMQIWRRVGETTFEYDSCQTGMPEHLGFTLIKTIALKDASGLPVTSWTDDNFGKGLEANAQYCYRLVAIYPLPKGGESYVSIEKCITPFITSEPVITEVSVIKTGETDGKISVKWLPPIDTTEFLKPYQYQLQRASGTGFINVGAKDTLTSRIDSIPTLNTYDERHFYRVLLYSASFPGPVDTSSVASSVWLELNPQKSRIQLVWSAIVPWSNQLEAYPIHLIYRGPEGADESQMVLIDSINVLQDGFVYLDSGRYEPGDTLNGTKTYCYRVKARGGYGFPEKIPEPLQNFSQINCAQPTDEVPPCAPIIDISASLYACEDFGIDYGCDATEFENVINWSLPSVLCEDDVRSYKVYYSFTKNGVYNFLEKTVESTYTHDSLGTLAYCYRITAVDRSNNESAMSNAVCNDNCPYYELPNVFSPNGDGCNDLFRAFGDDLQLGEDPECPEADADVNRCARFVQKVDLVVYNRWGNKVYSYSGQQGNENTIYIRWDGRDDKGQELATAVYFYKAEVTYDVIDPDDRVKTIKGWVHLLR